MCCIIKRAKVRSTLAFNKHTILYNKISGKKKPIFVRRQVLVLRAWQCRFLTQKSVLETKKAKKFRSIIAQLSNALSQGDSCIEINKEEQSIVLASGMADNSGKFPVVLESNKLSLKRFSELEIC
jgi:hypothetical protein